MKKAFVGLISRLDMPNKRNNELQDMSMETSKAEIQREKSMKKIE